MHLLVMPASPLEIMTGKITQELTVNGRAVSRPWNATTLAGNFAALQKSFLLWSAANQKEIQGALATVQARVFAGKPKTD